MKTDYTEADLRELRQAITARAERLRYSREIDEKDRERAHLHGMSLAHVDDHLRALHTWGDVEPGYGDWDEIRGCLRAKAEHTARLWAHYMGEGE